MHKNSLAWTVSVSQPEVGGLGSENVCAELEKGRMVYVPPSQACRKQNKQRTNECLIVTNNLKKNSHSADYRPGQDVKLTLLPRGGLKKGAEKAPRTHPPHFFICHRQEEGAFTWQYRDNLGKSLHGCVRLHDK